MGYSRRTLLISVSLAGMLTGALSFSTLTRPIVRRPFHRLNVATTRDADFVEQMLGGERYEMIPLPDSMLATTIFVGNLCEFVTDDILSSFFSSVSRMISVPACVARKPNMSSLQYGFVTFPTVEEKEVRASVLAYMGTLTYSHYLDICYRLPFFAFTVQSCMDVPSKSKRFGTLPIAIASVFQEKWSHLPVVNKRRLVTVESTT